MFHPYPNLTADPRRRPTRVPRASCPRHPSTAQAAFPTGRAGLTLVELLVAAAIMAIVVAALAFLAKAVYMGADYSTGHGEAIQHARVTLERITRMANEATTSPEFPGMLVLVSEEGDDRYPDTLIVWHPTTKAFDPDGLPRFKELVIFCPKVGRPNELIELTAPGDTRTVPDYTDLNDWAEEIEALRNSSATRQTVLTDLVRTALAVGGGTATRRPCVRFDLRLRPSAADLAQFEASDVEWKKLPWVQNIYSESLGLRQVWLRTELQLMPGHPPAESSGVVARAIPFFDSASVYYTLRNED